MFGNVKADFINKVANMSGFDAKTVQQCRMRFPALLRKENDTPAIFFDGPAGTQVPNAVVDAMTEYLVGCNANHGGFFGTANQSERWVDKAHQAFADIVGADDPDEIIFGQNMTSLTFAFSRSLSKTWEAGDEIIVTRLDHDANVTPWVQAAAEAGATVKWLDFNRSDHHLDMEQFETLLGPKTKLVAAGCASNATGGINPVKRICELAHEHGALVYLDAVHYGPHGLIDVKEWGCDFLACSAYKFFGPHLGTLWGRRTLLESLEPYKVRPSKNKIPDRWMTGTQSYESIVGGMSAIEYLADLGCQFLGKPDAPRREALISVFNAIREYEASLSKHMLDGLAKISGVKVYGVTDTDRLDERFPTFSITHEAIKTTELAKLLCEKGVYVWHGHYYALGFTEGLNLEPEGMVRIGLVHYNTVQEIDRMLAIVEDVVHSETI